MGFLGHCWLCVAAGGIALEGAAVNAADPRKLSLISSIVASTTRGIDRFVGTGTKYDGNPLMNQTKQWEMSGINNGYPTAIYHNNVPDSSSPLRSLPSSSCSSSCSSCSCSSSSSSSYSSCCVECVSGPIMNYSTKQCHTHLVTAH